MHDVSFKTRSEVAASGDFSGDSQACDVQSFVDERLAANSGNLFDETLLLVERYLISRMLQLTRGNQSKAALMLGITRGSLRNKIHAQGIAIEQIVREAAAARSAGSLLTGDPQPVCNG